MRVLKIRLIRLRLTSIPKPKYLNTVMGPIQTSAKMKLISFEFLVAYNPIQRLQMGSTDYSWSPNISTNPIISAPHWPMGFTL